jgi:hypothetical protein
MVVIAAAALLGACAQTPVAPPVAVTPPGEVQGRASVHTAASQLALPAQATGGAAFFGRWSDAPAAAPGATRVPVVVFLHGSSGPGLKAIEEWQRWLLTLGVASVAPDSFALPERLTYKSPVDKSVYERIHALRTSEIEPTRAAVLAAAWADPTRLVLAGTSEGAVSVARHAQAGFAARMLYAWSCEDNYFVAAHRTVVKADEPVLNVISASDPFFSSTNAWVGTAAVTQGHCGAVFGKNKRATTVLIGDAPHTLLNLVPARDATAAFLRGVLAR